MAFASAFLMINCNLGWPHHLLYLITMTQSSSCYTGFVGTGTLVCFIRLVTFPTLTLNTRILAVMTVSAMPTSSYFRWQPTSLWCPCFTCSQVPATGNYASLVSCACYTDHSPCELTAMVSSWGPSITAIGLWLYLTSRALFPSFKHTSQ